MQHDFVLHCTYMCNQLPLKWSEIYSCALTPHGPSFTTKTYERTNHMKIKPKKSKAKNIRVGYALI